MQLLLFHVIALGIRRCTLHWHAARQLVRLVVVNTILDDRLAREASGTFGRDLQLILLQRMLGQQVASDFLRPDTEFLVHFLRGRRQHNLPGPHHRTTEVSIHSHGLLGPCRTQPLPGALVHGAHDRRGNPARHLPSSLCLRVVTCGINTGSDFDDEARCTLQLQKRNDNHEVVRRIFGDFPAPVAS